MDKEQPLAELYYEKLQTTDKPAVTLVNFMSSLFDGLTIDGKVYGRVGKLVKVYGKMLVYYSILDCATLDNMEINKLLNYINYNCKRRFESKNSNTPFNDLTDMAKKIREQLESL